MCVSFSFFQRSVGLMVRVGVFGSLVIYLDISVAVSIWIVFD